MPPLSISHSLIFTGTAIWLCAVMTMLTPRYVETLKEAVKLGSSTIVLLLLGTLVWFVGVYLEMIHV